MSQMVIQQNLCLNNYNKMVHFFEMENATHNTLCSGTLFTDDMLRIILRNTMPPSTFLIVGF
jgi:hypothetical protein